MTLKAQPNCCEEAATGMGTAYFPCNQPATKVVGWRGRSESPIRMCTACASHNVKSRGGFIVSDYIAGLDQTYMNPKYEARYSGEPSLNQLDAMKLVLLFYTIDWTPEKKAEWLRITGSSEATTKVMCDHIRSAISIYEEQGNLMRTAVEAAIAYDALIQSAANDPAKMSSVCTVEGDDLDALYEDWITKSRKALGMGPPK